MSRVRTIPDAVTIVQTEAADPKVSAFVSANAGSGKTHVLAQRVIRLLLAGVDPAKILCITFTKAAAANMAERVFGQLAGWISLDDAALDAKLRALGVKTISPKEREQARKLFAAALDTPGGLKVETIHAFCTRLLQRFPFEAAVPAHFSVLDERATDELLDRATLGVLLDATTARETALGRALSNALAAAADQTLRDLVREAVFRRHALTGWIESAGGLDQAISALSAALGVAPGETLADIDRAIVEGPLLPSSEWAAVAAVCNGGSSNDQKQGARLSTAAAAAGPERLEAYLDVFLTGKREPRKAVVTSTLAKKHPGLAERLMLERDRVVALVARRAAAMCRDRTAALVTIATAVIARYGIEKNRRGLLDYDDLIDKTLALLGHTAPGWVHYKLDRAIDHVLIDEAQDTSPKQWEIIRLLVAEFTAGAGARATRRSIFAVGDEKQSIFSFQGAVPKEFARMRRHFETAHKASGLTFLRRDFKFSFRSGANILGAVDAVFETREMFSSVTSDEAGVPPHEPLPDAAPGVVELWPLTPAEPRPEQEGWDAPFDATVETSPQVRLAKRIAETIRDAIARREPAGHENRPLRAGDVLVLVRQRGAMFQAVIRALEEAGVPVAGADRLALTEHVAVVDLMALADAILLPTDDLALAIALKSPLFGFDDELLFQLARGRGGSLHAALQTAAEESPAFAVAAACFARCAEAARRHGPFDFFSWLLGAEGGRARVLARLGSEANDALDEFLALALDYERRETPSLQGFVAWLRAAESEIKRDMEITRDEVRVMTVHGAKGLEAPLVFLADTTQPPAGPRPPRLLTLAPDGAPPDTPGAIVWAGRKEADPAVVARARAAAAKEAEDEYRRLLYVAMTRAAYRLIVCGCAGVRKPPEGCWHDLIRTQLAGKPGVTEETIEGHDAPVHVYRKILGQPLPAPEPPEPATAEPAEPGWLRAPVVATPLSLAPVSPSRVLDSVAPARPRSADTELVRKAARLRGTLAHRLLQSLPDLPREARAAAADALLARNATELDAAERARLLAQALAILDDTRFAALFGPGSRAEVPIVGRLMRREGPPLLVSGQIDRLAVTDDAVLIADFKTNRPAPRRLADAPPAYVAQLALYGAVLASLYPGKPVRAALVWTDTPDLMDVSAESRDVVLARLGVAAVAP
ncbi:MAG: double-strand break repair helicase AddA [Rhodoplanes sp.]|uniref:double-strand break repair helicase AddA n=1 Tax=Rhodoplanes sp. TaxID=1968906 RepID=UPI0017926C15|nr:double-strand break repair helicase AddA [Rhodoplanes sp.]NVO15592.1 double-strand break repair helicase AddA [Rhodoplanes sp.]